MSEINFLAQFGAALLAALIGGLIARMLRLPVLIGYLLAGVVVGPHTPGFSANSAMVNPVAHLGVALLMFMVGVHTSLRELQAVRTTAIVGGGVQITGTLLLGLCVGLAFGWGAYGGLFLGCALALSSTAVMMRILEERGELGTGHGTAMLGILVVQDLAVVVMVALLPSIATLSTQGAGGLSLLGLSLLKAILFVGGIMIVARRIVPLLLNRIARTGSQELFLLTAVCVCLAAAELAQALGLSLELGAFLAGLIISEEYSHEVFAQIRPLRDLFAALFFVSVGMMMNPDFFVQHWGKILVVVTAIVVGKTLFTFIPLYAVGWHGRTALIAGLGLAQIGEFSFVLATIGVQRKLIPPEIASVILSSALVTLLLAPLLYGSAGPLYERLNKFPALSRFFNRQGKEEPFRPHKSGESVRALIVGAGRVGRYVSGAFQTNGIHHLVVDYDRNAVERLREQGVNVTYGDASSPGVLEHLPLGSVDLAVVALPEAGTTEKVVREMRQKAPNLSIVARVHRGIDIPRMRNAGADMVIHAEFEAGVEMIRQSLERLGMPDREVESYVEGFRQHRYREEIPV